jgi:hypothetical protein
MDGWPGDRMMAHEVFAGQLHYSDRQAKALGAALADPQKEVNPPGNSRTRIGYLPLALGASS